MLRNLLEGLVRRRGCGGGRRGAYRQSWRLNLEVLEQRKLLSIDCYVSSPLDGGGSDLDPISDAVHVTAEQASFKIKLTDDTYTIDDASANDADNVDLSKDGSLLTEGVGNDYTFSYSSANDEITLTSVGGNFGIGKYVINLEGVENSNSELMTPAEFRIQIGQMKNLVLFIGDGMGKEQVKVFEEWVDRTALFNDTSYFPFTADVDTRSGSYPIVTDSAAAATAMATGVEVLNGVISYDPSISTDIPTALEYYAGQGKYTGLITTTNISHTTPAPFAAHEPDTRTPTNVIDDYCNQDPLVNIFMGGSKYVDPEDVPDDYVVVEDEGDMNELDPGNESHVWGMFGDDHMPYLYDGLGDFPELHEMTDFSRDVLDNDADGFYAMIEGGRIDHACQANDVMRMVYEISGFEEAVEAIYDWADSRTDTLIIVTADHETGGLIWDGPEWDDVDWTTTGRTGVDVGMYGWGVGADAIQGSSEFHNEFIFNLLMPDTTAPTAALADDDPSGFEIQLSDDGRGIDDATVDAATLTMKKGTTTLTEGTDYDFAYNSEMDKITLTKTGGGDFDYGEYTIVLNGGTNKITDYGVPANELAQTTIVIGVTGFGNGKLYVYGTPDADSITVAASGGKVTVNGSELDPTVNASSVSHIYVYAYAGGDTINLSGVNGTDYTSLYYTKIYGDDGADTITGSALRDYIYGGEGGDAISAGSGNDYLYGEADDDSLVGGADNDWYCFSGSADLGSDSITETSGTADGVSFSGAGSAADFDMGDADPQTDVLTGKLDLDLNSGSVIERLSGSSHADSITGNGLDNYIYASSGDDTVDADDGDDTVYGGSGKDSLTGGEDDDSLDGGPGDDTIRGNDGDDTIRGKDDEDPTSVGDVLYGNDGADLMYGDGDGYGYGIKDTIEGGDDADTIYAGDGEDLVKGGIVGDGNGYGDLIYGEDGDDTLYGGEAIGTDDDTDTIYGGEGADSIFGEDGWDELFGGDGDDTIYGGDNYDDLDGGADDDELYGGDDGDGMIGGPGDDTLDGGDGSDYYSFSGTAALGTDVINEVDTDDGNDVLSFYSLNRSETGVFVDIAETDPQVVVSGVTIDLSHDDIIERVYGTQYDDTIYGNTLDNYLRGYDGEDIIYGQAGDDTLYGDDDDDDITGGTGADTVHCGAGDDTVWLLDGVADWADGGSGTDSVGSADGSDTLLNFELPVP